MVEICRRLDGIPLAIELAAARTSALSPHAIAGRLNDRFRLFRGGRRGERHQTLHDAVQWSYELLGEAEAALFDRLAVFAGGFSVAAAEAICSDDQLVEELDVLDLLAGLVDKSMIQRDRNSDERFVMLETLRQFAEERLDNSGGARSYRYRHACYYRDLVVAEETRLASPNEPDSWRVLHQEWDNIRTAFEHGLAAGDADVMAELCAGLGWFAPMSFHSEAGSWASAAIRSGLLEGHRAETAVRGTWAITEFHLSGGQAFNGVREALGELEAADPKADRWAAWLTAGFLLHQAQADRLVVDAVTSKWCGAGQLAPVAAFHAASLRGFASVVFDLDDEPSALAARGTALADLTGAPTLQAWAAHLQGIIAVLSGLHSVGVGHFRRSQDLTSAIPFEVFSSAANEMWLAIAAVLSEDDLHAAIGTCRDALQNSLDRRLNATVLTGLRAAALALARSGEIELAATLLGAADGDGARRPLHAARSRPSPPAHQVRAARRGGRASRTRTHSRPIHRRHPSPRRPQRATRPARPRPTSHLNSKSPRIGKGRPIPTDTARFSPHQIGYRERELRETGSPHPS